MFRLVLTIHSYTVTVDIACARLTQACPLHTHWNEESSEEPYSLLLGLKIKCYIAIVFKES